MTRLVAGCLIFAAIGCIYDPDERCGETRVFDGKVCACKPGLVEVEGRCVRASDSGVMADAATGDDAAQSGEDSGAPSSVTACTEHTQCGDGRFCSEGECATLPTGEGKPCTSQAECASYDASYCTLGSPFGETCTVPNCTEHSCSPGRACIDVSAFAPGTPKLCTEEF